MASLLLVLPLGGCASARVTDPRRTATEQFLLSQAAAEAVAKLSYDALRGRDVFVETRYFAASEQAFVIGELRARLLLNGVSLVEDRTRSQIILEVRSGGVGIDREDFLLGVPSLAEATPELAITKRLAQRGFASVGYIAYWTDTGEVVSNSGPYIGRSLRDDFWLFGIGPKSLGDIPTVQQPDEAEGRPGAPAEDPAKAPGSGPPAPGLPTPPPAERRDPLQ